MIGTLFVWQVKSVQKKIYGFFCSMICILVKTLSNARFSFGRQEGWFGWSGFSGDWLNVIGEFPNPVCVKSSIWQEQTGLRPENPEMTKQWGPESTENGYGNQWEVLSTKWETLPSRVPAAPRLGSMSVSHLPILASCHLTQVFETKMKAFSEELKDIWASGVADCLSSNGQRQ